MIEPVAFGYNTETAANNYFMRTPEESAEQLQQKALDEFRGMVRQLQQAGIHVIVEQDRLYPPTPDSVFPNNWVSFHEGGRAVIYPMYAESRRSERRMSVFERLKQEGFSYSEIFDLSHFEQRGLYLEGTGSMVLDRKYRIAYASLSERTSLEVLSGFCERMNYTAEVFSAFQQVGQQRLAVYHTNVLLCIAEQFGVICLECIDNPEERRRVADRIKATGKELIEITEAQLHQFAGNMLQVRTLKGELKLIVSGSAYASLLPEQISRLQLYNELIVCNVPTIEKYGGGSVRCMIAEIF